jgi:hypothetical protein
MNIVNLGNHYVIGLIRTSDSVQVLTYHAFEQNDKEYHGVS